jgi:hypothetical protein
MPQANVIRWRDGGGWIVLSGSGDFRAGESSGVEDIEAQAIERAIAGKPLAYIFAASDIDQADDHLLSLEDLGAPAVYLVDVLQEDDDTIIRQLREAGIIFIGDGRDLDALRSGLVGAAAEGLAQAFEDGAIILAEGSGARALGDILSADPQAKHGLNWVERAAIMPGYEADGAPQRLRDLLVAHPDAYGLGIGTGSALALGSEGQVEAWGKRQLTVMLGSNFKT